MLGTSFTIRVPQGDNLMFHAAMDLAKSGDVIAVDAGGYEKFSGLLLEPLHRMVLTRMVLVK